MDLAALAIVDGVVCMVWNERSTRDDLEDVRTGELVHDALLPDVEALARGVSPPLLQLAFLVIQPSS